MHDLLLENQPEGARHDSSICPVCADKAQADPSSRIPHGGNAGPDVSEANENTPSTEGGIPDPMSDTISKETHDALLAKAVTDATADAASKIDELTKANEKLTADNAALSSAKTTLESDNAELNKKLDAAEVEKNAAVEKASKAEQELEQTKADAAKADVASTRSTQVRNLKLFTDEQISERADRWAELSDEDWTDRLAEWAALKPSEAGETAPSDAASALSGTTESLTTTDGTQDTAAGKGDDKPPAARRAVLGLS